MRQKILLLLLGVLSALPALARDFEYTYEGQTLTYTVIDEDAKTCMTKEGEAYQVGFDIEIRPGNHIRGSLIIPEVANDGTADYTVISIGGYAFYGCSGLTSVVIPNYVISIDRGAFYDCSGLTSVVIGNSVISIGGYAFYGCSGLTSVVIPNYVTSIDGYAFKGCSGMKKAEFSSIESLCNIAFYDVTSNPLYYAHCLYIDGKEVTEVVIPETVTTIGGYAFSGCSGLTSVVIPNSVTSIGWHAFSGCSSLTSVVIPNSVTKISFSTFSGCSGLTSVVIGNSVTSIGDSAFEGCSGLKKSAYPATLDDPFGRGRSIAYNPEGAMIEDGFVFGPDRTAIYFAPLSLDGDYSIPETVTSIGEYAFYGCSGLTKVTAFPIRPAVMNDNSFSGLYDKVSLSVPDEAVGSYLATNWSLFNDIQNNSGKELGSFSDGVFEYRLNPADMTATVIGAKSYSSLQIPERFTDDSDPANPVRYYIKGIGYKAFDGKDVNSVEFNSRSQMEYLGDYAFADTKISSISLPSTMRSIGEHAFAKAPLTSISIPVSVSEIGNHAFYKTQKLSEVELNEGLASIGDYAFAESGLTSISIPGSVSEIGNHAFYKTQKLSGVELKEGLASIGNYAFAESGLTSITIPGSVATIGDYAFYNTSGLSNVEMKEGLESIGSGAFRADNKRSVTGNPLYLPSTVKSVGRDAFENFVCSQVGISDLSAWCGIDFGNGLANPICVSSDGLFVNGEKLTILNVPEDIKEIKPYAFYNCKSLEEVTFPEGLEKLGANSFYGCPITALTIPASVVEIGLYAFSAESVTFTDGLSALNIDRDPFSNRVTDLYWGRPLESLNFSLNVSSLGIGNLITEIPDGKFKNMNNLKSLYIGSSIQAIGDGAFSGCTKLAEVILPPSVETIGASAFAGDSSLESIIMGHSMKTIGEKAFDGCKASTVSITAQTPPTAPNNTFSNYSGKLYLQGEKARDAYYDAFTCWDRFDSYVMIDAEKITVEGTGKISGNAGDTFQLTASIWPENVTLPQIFWHSTNPEIATVDENGLVTLHVDLEKVLTRAQGEGDIDGTCTIIAETLYNDGPVAQVTVDNTGVSVVESIPVGDNGSIDYSLPYDVYNMNGLKVSDSTEGLDKGIYIIRQGKAAMKTVVR